MIFKSQFPTSPDVDIVISGVSVDYTSIESVEIDFEENAHDMAAITFVGLPTKAVTDYINAPVSITISTSPARTSSFHGYVSYVEPELATRRGLINNSPIQKAKVVCFGSSIDMVEKKSKIWENISMPQLVKSIADQYQMSYSVPDDYFVWNRVLQNDKSNWEILVETCNALGYFVTANGTHIHVYDPYKVLSRQLPYVELTSVRGARGSVTPIPGRIMELTGTFGEYTPDGHASTFKYVGIDNNGNLISTETLDNDEDFSGLGEKVYSKYVNTVTKDVTSLEMLKRFAGAALRKRYPYNVSVSTIGLAEPMPGSVAKINEYDSYFDGYWLVRSVKHMVTRSNYVTNLSLSSDATNKALPTFRPVGAFKQPPTSILNNENTWVAQFSMEDIYAR